MRPFWTHRKVGALLIVGQFACLTAFTDGGAGVTGGWLGGIVFSAGYLLIGAQE